MSAPASALLKRWRTVEASVDEVDGLVDALGVSRPIATVLAARGLADPKAAERFLRPRLSDLADPFILPGMRDAVTRLWSAVDGGESIVVFGDYDVDGVSSAALLVSVLRRLGAKAAPFLPHRVEDGYGLSPEALRKCTDAHQPQLIVTVDCGTGSVAAVDEAREAGTDVIVTDHHEPSGEVAKAWAVVNPKLASEGAGSPLAGVGVTFKLCHALLKDRLGGAGKGTAALDLRHYLDYVALGTIADVVPLVGENRILSKRGLERLNATECTGLRALRAVCGIDGDIEAYHVGFILGPRLNAAGRLGDAQQALDLLLTTDKDRATELASTLDRSNRERRDVEARMLEEALAEVDAGFDPEKVFVVVVARENWHPGVMGIVASRLSERYYRPAVVIAIDEDGRGRGSCRSIAEFNLVEALESCSHHLLKFGGHTMAAGLELEAEHILAFAEELNRLGAEALGDGDLRPEQRVDAWIDLREADETLLAELEQLQPFGFGHPTPVWAAQGVRVAGKPREVGQGHLKMRVCSGMVECDCIGFGLWERDFPEGPLDIAFNLRRNSYRGRESLQLVLKDFRPSRGVATS